MKVVDQITNDLRTDVTWNRVGTITARGARALPLGTKHYLLDKVPIVGWLPKYNLRWIVNDVIAGLTLGLLLIPQSLSYAKIATIPVEYGLQSSWLPATLYTFMGSTKDLSTGPTSLIGLMTSNAVSSLKPQGYSPQAIASAVAMCMGIMGMAIGFLNLGFLLEFISEPILAGFITAVALTIGLGQIRQILRQLPQANGYACAVGFAGLLFLVLLEQSGKRWANQKTMLSRTIWFFSITRAFMCLLLFTGVSYAVNKHRGKHTLFDIVQLKYSGISAPEVPSATLIGKAFPGAIPAFIGGILEHVAIARAFGVKNNYVSDQTQEVTYFGVINFVNSFFHSMGVGGAMSRTSVNSMCKVKSPLSGLVTTAVILVCIFKLSGALYWIPKATLSAIIITVSPAIRYRLASARDRNVERMRRNNRVPKFALADTFADLHNHFRQLHRSSGLPESSTGSGRHRSRTSCKSTAITTAKRLAEFLGEQMVKDKGLNCKYIIAARPKNAPVTERAIPVAIFSAEESVRRFYLRKWMKEEPTADMDPRSIIAWEYYLERLGSVIQKLITIPAALQKVSNPVPRVAHPEWLDKRIRTKEDVFKQAKMTDMFQKRPLAERDPNLVSPRLDMEDFGATPMSKLVKPATGARIVQKQGGAQKRKAIEPAAAAATVNLYDSLLAVMPSITEDYKGWLRYQKQKWKIQKAARKRRRQLFGEKLRPNLQRLAANTVDLISSAMLAFWVCFFTTTYEGLAAAVGFNIIYVLLRQVFKPITQVGSTDQQKLSELQQSTLSASGLPDTLPDDVRIFRFHESFFFPNAYRLKTAILETIQTHHAPAYSTLHGAEAERNWSVHGERRVARLRKKAGIVDPSTLPPISIVVLDFTKVNHMDATAISHLHSLLKELRLYAGPGVEVRFVGVSKTIRERFERARFTLHDDPWLATDQDDTWTENVPRAYRNLSVAVQAPRRRSSAVLVEKNEKMEHIEEV
ncbi:hypothetical protein LTR59_014307 [Friedmanniomyces endolithicus]|nr:hypothetical protein LTR94_005777 [Friedmanniomyces endolithicus]KAK0776115.1 hypothetical protein LTR59_014307 [Friedmanniomyces endolithicus]KAK0777379.1 hypothetical protein LTR38_015179 [Friedmanniomyces endolithicus]